MDDPGVGDQGLDAVQVIYGNPDSSPHGDIGAVLGADFAVPGEITASRSTAHQRGVHHHGALAQDQHQLAGRAAPPTPGSRWCRSPRTSTWPPALPRGAAHSVVAGRRLNRLRAST